MGVILDVSPRRENINCELERHVGAGGPHRMTGGRRCPTLENINCELERHVGAGGPHRLSCPTLENVRTIADRSIILCGIATFEADTTYCREELYGR